MKTGLFLITYMMCGLGVLGAVSNHNPDITPGQAWAQAAVWPATLTYAAMDTYCSRGANICELSK